MTKRNTNGHTETDGKKGGDPGPTTETGRTLLVGLLGGLASAAGYVVYQRLPEEQKDRLQAQVRGLIESRLNEIRQNFNI